jgi:hypothetical protein
MNTWNQIIEEIPEILRFDASNNNLDLEDDSTWSEYAHEWADGAQEVIYYHRARDLWMTEAEIQDYESDAREIWGASATIDEMISACVYLALCDRIMAALQDARSESAA